MLSIRNTQLHILAHRAHDAFMAQMAVHVRNHFPASACLLTPEELHARVHACIQRAARYGLTSQQQVCRFINVAASYGWAFDNAPEHAWMHAVLVDPSLPTPGERLDFLVQSCLQRQRIAQENAAARQMLGLPRAQTTPPAEAAQDYLGTRRNRPRPLPAQPQGLMSRSAMRYWRSHSLWQADEFISSANQQTG